LTSRGEDDERWQKQPEGINEHAADTHRATGSHNSSEMFERIELHANRRIEGREEKAAYVAANTPAANSIGPVGLQRYG